MDEEASAILTATAITTSMAAISTVRRAFRSDYMALRIRTAPATPAATTISGATGFRLLGAIHTKRTALSEPPRDPNFRAGTGASPRSEAPTGRAYAAVANHRRI